MFFNNLWLNLIRSYVLLRRQLLAYVKTSWIIVREYSCHCCYPTPPGARKQIWRIEELNFYIFPFIEKKILIDGKVKWIVPTVSCLQTNKQFQIYENINKRKLIWQCCKKNCWELRFSSRLISETARKEPQLMRQRGRGSWFFRFFLWLFQVHRLVVVAKLRII